MFNGWAAGTKIDVDEPTKISENDSLTNLEKFNSCKHRSETEEKITIRSCCSSIDRMGWRCLKRNIDFLSPTLCGPCNVYERKEIKEASQEEIQPSA